MYKSSLVAEPTIDKNNFSHLINNFSDLFNITSLLFSVP